MPLSVNDGCQATVNDVKIVTSCPKSKEEWDIAALNKNCSKLAAVAKTKNCTIKEKQPEYHCVFNSLRNKLLEVCADKRFIFGYCTEFNELGGVIQNHYQVPCEKCNDSYYSSDAYKYQRCYELVNQTLNSTDLDLGIPELGNETKFSFSITFTVTFASILLCGLAVTIVLFCKRRSELPIKEIDIEEGESLMDDNRNGKETTTLPTTTRATTPSVSSPIPSVTPGTPTPSGPTPSVTPTPSGPTPSGTPPPNGPTPSVTPTPSGPTPSVTPTPSGPTPSGPTPSVTPTPSGPTPAVTPKPSGPTTTTVTTCVDEMLTAGPNVLSPSSDDIPVENIPNVFNPVGASKITSNPSPTVEFTLNSDQPPQVTTVKATVLNAEKVEVTLEQPNGEKTTKTPVISPDGTVEVNFKGETGSKIIITITKKDPTAPSTVSGVEVKACTEEAESKPFRQYLYCKAEEFEHFHFIYDQIWEYKQQLDNENRRHDLTIEMPKNVVIRIELVGKFTIDNLQLLPRGKLSKKEKKDETIWETILVCFENYVSLKSALEARREECACNMILIKSVLVATDNKTGSIRVVDQNKENILDTITSYLEKPLGDILQKWSDIYTERVDEIMAFKKTILDHNKDNKTPNVADNKEKCLSRKPDKVNDTNTKTISRRGQVNKDTDDKELRTFINSESFEKDPLKEEKRKLFWSLSGILVKTNKDESDTFAPTDRHEFTKTNQTTYTEDKHLSNQGEFSVLKLTMNQTEDNQNGEKSVGFEGIRYSNQEHEVHTTRHNKTNSTENSDE